jgi:hypothetical protein
VAQETNRPHHSPQKRARAVELVRGGLTARAAAEAMGEPGLWRSIARWASAVRDATYGDAPPGFVRVAPRSLAQALSPPSQPPDPVPAPAPQAGTPGEAFDAELAALFASERDPTMLDVGELAALCRLLTRHLATATGAGDWNALTKLFEFRKTLSLTLKQVRPPEKVDPLRDPTNLEALAELRARYAAMRDPLEVSPPLVAAMRAHLAELERRAGGGGEAEEVA